MLRGQICDAQSLAASFTTEAVLIQDTTVVGVELYSASGTRAGTINIQESISGDNWASIQLNDSTLTTDTSIPVTASTVLTKVYNLAGLGGKWLRIKYTATSGTGALDCYILAKRVV